MIRWPFISRSTHDLLLAQKQELRAEVLELKIHLRDTQEEVKRLNNYWTWRMAGAPVHPEMIPPEYRVQPDTTPAVDPMKEEQPSEVEEVIDKLGSRNPRRIVRGIQIRRDQEAPKAVPAKATSVSVAAQKFEEDLQLSEGKTA